MAPRTRNRPKKKYMTVQSTLEKLAKKQVLDKLCHDAITAQANSKNNKLPLGYFKQILDNDEFNVKKEDYNWYKVSSFKHHLYALKKKNKIQQAITPADNPDGLPPPPPPLSNKGGRPKGSTNAKKKMVSDACKHTRNIICTIVLQKRNELRTEKQCDNVRLPKGFIEKTIKEVVHKNNLPSTHCITTQFVKIIGN